MTATHPGATLVKFGLILLVVGVLLTLVTLMYGGNAVALWISAAGVVLALIGFSQRILAALEK